MAIDLGTTFIKGAVLDLDSRQIRHVQRLPFPDPLPGLPALHREFDPKAIMAAVHSLLDNLLAAADAVEGIVFCSQMHCTVFSTYNGQARSNLVNWQDERIRQPHPSGAGTYFEVMQQRLDTDEIRQLGNELRPGLPVGLLFWLQEQASDPIEPQLIVASLPDFVIANLCHCPPVTELTNAAAYGLLNLETGWWHASVIDKLGLKPYHLPEIKVPGTIAGILSVDGRKIPCYSPVGDYQCALVGSLLQQSELSLNIATGSQVSLLADRPIFGDFQTRPYFDGLFTTTITNIPAGRALNGLVGLLSELATAQGIALIDPWDYIIRAATAAETSQLQVNLSFYSNTINVAGTQGSIANINESDLTVGHLFRAAFQNMADNYYAGAIRLSPDKTWLRLVFSGGLSQKVGILRDLIVNKFQTSYRMTPHVEDTLFGLLVLATAFSGRATGVIAASNQLLSASNIGEEIVGNDK